MFVDGFSKSSVSTYRPPFLNVKPPGAGFGGSGGGVGLGGSGGGVGLGLGLPRCDHAHSATTARSTAPSSATTCPSRGALALALLSFRGVTGDAREARRLGVGERSGQVGDVERRGQLDRLVAESVRRGVRRPRVDDALEIRALLGGRVPRARPVTSDDG